MMSMTIVGSRPGRRLEGYRNSTPRTVKVLGVGAMAEAVLQDLAADPKGNILIQEAPTPEPLPLDAPLYGLAPGAVIVVLDALEGCASFPYRIERTAATLSVIVLEPLGQAQADKRIPDLSRIRGVSDLFATTSDPEFVYDLVVNLAG
jgi:hypothetical protein